MSGEEQKRNKRTKQPRTRVEVPGEGAVGVGGNVNHSSMTTGDNSPVVKVDVPVTINSGASTQPASPPPRQLPSDITDFTGRKRELSELRKALEQGDGHVVISALNGMGGVGKTTLAVHVAHQLADRYPDAQIVVDMQGTSQPLAPIEAMLRVIRAFHPETPAADDINQVAHVYRNLLAGKRVLILLDNASDTAQVRPLVPPAPCALIVTSRRAIALGRCTINLDALSAKDARTLLREILNKRRATDQQLNRIAELCGRLPLALRVAGTFLVVHRDWTTDEYIEALTDERQRLERLKQDDLDVEAVLGLSAKQLEQESAELALRWRMLAVFPESFDRAAAAAVWEAEPAEARDSLSKLLECNLVLYDEETARYRLHDLVRLITSAQCDEGERIISVSRHANYYKMVLGKAQTLYSQGGDAFKQGLVLFDLEWRNIKAGQTWAALQCEMDDAAAELCSNYAMVGTSVLQLRCHPREIIHWVEIALTAARRLKKPFIEGIHLGSLGVAYADLGQVRHAIELYEQRLVIAREAGDRHGEGATLGNLGRAYAALGETLRAIEFYEQRLAIARGIGDRRGEGITLGNMGAAYGELGEFLRTIKLYEQQLVIARELGDWRIEGNALGGLGVAYDALGETQRAIEYHKRYLAIAREIGDRRGESNALLNLGATYAKLGKMQAARELFEQRLTIAQEIGDKAGESDALFNISLILIISGEREQALLYTEAALKIYEQIESPTAQIVRNMLAESFGEKSD